MPGRFFPRLEKQGLIRDADKQFLNAQTISAQKLITGSLQASQVISSSNFVSGTSGWQIDGDGNAEFNDVTVRGDIVSSNWDGSDPLALSTRDTGASVGFALDSSEGAGQFEGDLFVGGNLQVAGNGELVVGDDPDSGNRMIMTAFSGALVTRIQFIRPGATAATGLLQMDDDTALLRAPGDGSSFQLQMLNQSATKEFRFSVGGTPVMTLDASAGEVKVPTPNTTGSAANVNVSASNLVPLVRSTSALRYKKRVTSNVDYLADITLTPTKHWRPDDKVWRYGLIADWLADQDPLLGEYENGEIENYDTRAVLAVLAAKVNRLEGMVA